MIHDRDNKNCPCWVWDINLVPMAYLKECTCPNHGQIRADYLQKELDELRQSLKGFRVLLEGL